MPGASFVAALFMTWSLPPTSTKLQTLVEMPCVETSIFQFSATDLNLYSNPTAIYHAQEPLRAHLRLMLYSLLTCFASSCQHTQEPLRAHLGLIVLAQLKHVIAPTKACDSVK